MQLTREQEHVWEPKGTAQLMEVDGGLDAAGHPVAYDFRTYYPSNGAPTLALLLTGRVEPLPVAYEMGDRTSVPPYEYPALRVSIEDMAPIVRASRMRGVSALPNTFAHESYIDELAHAAGVDPLEYRLRYIHDERASELMRSTAERAGWTPHTEPMQTPAEDGVLRGRGFAYARYIHSKFPALARPGRLGGRRGYRQSQRRSGGDAHRGRPRCGHDGQPGRRAPPNSRQRVAIDQPGVERTCDL